MRTAPSSDSVAKGAEKGPSSVSNPTGKSTPLLRLELPDLTLYSVEFLIDAFAPTGLSRRGVLALLRALQVPTLAVGPYRLFDIDAFSLALKAILRVGNGDFLCPGTWRAARVSPSGHWTRELDVPQFKKDLRYIMAEWLASRRRNLPRYRQAAEANDLRRAQIFAERLIVFGLARTHEDARALLATLGSDETLMAKHRLSELTATGSLLPDEGPPDQT